jgi:hypothetical protein
MKALSKKNKILLGIGSGLLTVGVFIPVTVLLTKKKDKIQITKEHFENYYNQSVQTLYSQACANDNVSQSNSVAFDVACAFVNDFEIERSNYFSGLDSNSSKKDY